MPRTISESETLRRIDGHLAKALEANARNARGYIDSARELVAALLEQVDRGVHANPDDEGYVSELEEQVVELQEEVAELEDDVDVLLEEEGEEGDDEEDEDGVVLSERVEAIEYVHAQDGERYRHDFAPGVTMTLWDNGTVELERPDGKPLHAEFDVGEDDEDGDR